MSKLLRIDFYQVKSPQPLEGLLKRIWSLESDEARNFPFKDGPVRLRKLEQHGDFWVGDLMRIRLNEPAMIARVGGGERDVAKSDDEGLGENSAFLYSPERGYIACQRNRGGVPAGHTSYYIQQKAKLEDAIIFEPVLKQTATDQLLKLSKTRTMRLKIVPSSFSPQAASQAALSQLIDAGNSLECLNMEIHFTVGRERKRSMSLQGVTNMVKTVLRMRDHGSNVSALEVTGVEEGGRKSEILDFIDAALYSTKSIEPSKLTDEFFRRRVACLTEAWHETANVLI